MHKWTPPTNDWRGAGRYVWDLPAFRDLTPHPSHHPKPSRQKTFMVANKPAGYEARLSPVPVLKGYRSWARTERKVEELG